MTWTKIAENFPEDCARVQLSDAAVRTHLEGLVWAMRRENDGRLLSRDLPRFADTPNPTAAADELVAVGFWTQLPDGWQIEHQMEHQPESDVIAARRELNAERQRKHRRKGVGLLDPDPDGKPLSRRDETRDETRDPERSGTERNGSEQEVLRGTTSKAARQAEPEPPPSPSPERSLSVVPELAATGTEGHTYDLIDAAYDREF